MLVDTPTSSTPGCESERVTEFIARHCRPYDPTTDDYERPPFAADIREGKNDPIYNLHSYHTKVPPRGIIPYILHYTQPGDVIVDPFCGSGMTGVAAQMCGNPPAGIIDQFPELADRLGPRSCILNDLSPAACHIAYNYTAPVDLSALGLQLNKLCVSAEDRLATLYSTEHYEPAIGDYLPTRPEVAGRLVNPLDGVVTATLFGTTERTWELLTRAEVEARLGYGVEHLQGDSGSREGNLTEVSHWIRIPSTLIYTIWSDVYRCEGWITVEEPTGKTSTRGKNAGKPLTIKKRVARGCGRDIVLKDASLVHGHDDRQGSSFTCPHCQTPWQKSPLPWLRSEPVLSSVSWRGVDGSMQACVRRVSRKEVELAFTGPDEGTWFPDDALYANRELLTMGAGKRGIKRVSDFYFPRQLRSLAILFSELEMVSDERLRKAALFCFTAIVLKCSRLNRLRPSGAGDPLTGTLYLGSLIREEHVSHAWRRRVEAVLGNLPRGISGEVLVHSGDAAKMKWLPDSSVDFVFTDPPFGGNIFYADASILWESWLRCFTEVSAEMVIHRRSKAIREADGFVFKEIEDYSHDMALAFQEVFRILKPGRWAVVEFNNSDGNVFEVIKRAVTQAGFEIVNMLLLDKQQKSFKQVQGSLGKEDVVDKDVLFNLHKPASQVDIQQSIEGDLERQVANAVRQHLQGLPERIQAEPMKYSDEHRTTATINSMLMNTLIPRGVSVGNLNLPFIERVCARYFRKIGQKWYLRGEAVGNQGGSANLIEEEVRIVDEITAIEWLRQNLRAKSALIGELKPLWMRATGLLSGDLSQGLVLEDLLSENFWREKDTNRWREPTDDEREKMNDDRSIRVLHDAERYVSGSLRRNTSDSERCDWIDVLFQACRAIEDSDAQAIAALRGFEREKGYRLVARLFQSVLREKVTEQEFHRAQKQAGVASQKIADELEAQADALRVRKRKAEGPTLFDEIEDL